MKLSPLAGKRIVVTRPSAQAEGLAARIRQAGGEPLCLPAIEIQAISDPGAVFAVADRIEAFDLAIFVSRNAVRSALGLLRARRAGKPWPARLRVAAIGRGTRQELETSGFAAVLSPPAQADSEALLALPELAEIAGKRIVIFRGEGGRALLGETLAARGAQVEHAACYRRVRPAALGAPLAAWSGGAVDAVTVSSGEGLANLVAMLGEFAPRLLRETVFFVPHPRLAGEAARLGVREAIVGGPGDAETVAALVAYFSGAR